MAQRFPLTRRGLFRGIGSATVVASCTKTRDDRPSTAPTIDDALAPGEVGPGASSVRFTLDGEARDLAVEPRTTLLDALRMDLDVTGPKQVCDRGACGACMVLVDGVPRNSCMMLAHDVAGRDVTSVAGLASGDQLSALQAKFVEHDALQCGFCTSGMLVSCAALLKRSADPSKLTGADVQDAIAGNLCRCGTYPHIIAAVLDAAGAAQDEGA